MFDPEEKARCIARIHSPPRGLANENYEMLMMDIAQALREAEARGMERAVEIAQGDCGMHVDFWDSGKQAGIRAAVKAIRKAMQPGTEGAE